MILFLINFFCRQNYDINQNKLIFEWIFCLEKRFVLDNKILQILNNLITRVIVKSDKIFHKATSFMRVVPDFLVIGNSFCCKTLLYNYMIQHPLVIENLREETSFWINYYDRGIMWYKSNFPTLFHKKILKLIYKKEVHVGETINIPSQEIPFRIHKILADPKIIVILRNPIERTYVRYLADVRAGIEKRKFEDALEHPKPLSPILKKTKRNKIDGIDENTSLYISGSIYSYDLKRLNDFFPLKKMLFLTSEELIKDPLATVNEALKFLGLEPLKTVKKVGQNFEEKADKINPEIRNKLQKFFESYNKQLFDLIGKKLDWE